MEIDGMAETSECSEGNKIEYERTRCEERLFDEVKKRTRSLFYIHDIGRVYMRNDSVHPSIIPSRNGCERREQHTRVGYPRVWFAKSYHGSREALECDQTYLGECLEQIRPAYAR
jgi:hypothetical protein